MSISSEFGMILVAAIAALLPGIAWLFIWYRKDSKEPEPKQMVAMAFVWGMLAATPLAILFYLWPSFSGYLTLADMTGNWPPLVSMIVMTFALAFLEEFLKHKAVVKLGKRLGVEFDQIVDGIVYSVAAGLGFAVVENIFYFIAAIRYFDVYSLHFLGVVLFRSFGTMLAHSLFSGIFGLAWGHAFLSPLITRKHSFSVARFFSALPEALRFHVFFSHVLRGRKSGRKHEKAVLVCEGLLIATALHTVFNLLLELDVSDTMLTPLAVPLILGLFLFLSRQFLKRHNIEIMEPIKD